MKAFRRTTRMVLVKEARELQNPKMLQSQHHKMAGPTKLQWTTWKPPSPLQLILRPKRTRVEFRQTNFQ